MVAVGTSVVRAMESTHSTFRQLKTYDGWTSRFIFPPYKFKLADALITNFHTPQSTLLMLTAAFGGYDLIMEAYQTAMKEKYRMHAYGDALLVDLTEPQHPRKRGRKKAAPNGSGFFHG